MALRVLVLEDHDDARRQLRELLELWGYEVRDAADGSAALEAAAEFRPQAAIVDLGLPGQPDGHAVARALRSDPDQPFLIAYADFQSAADRRRAYDAGIRFVVPRSGAIDELKALLSVAALQTRRRAQ